MFLWMKLWVLQLVFSTGKLEVREDCCTPTHGWYKVCQLHEYGDIDYIRCNVHTILGSRSWHSSSNIHHASCACHDECVRYSSR